MQYFEIRNRDFINNEGVLLNTNDKYHLNFTPNKDTRDIALIGPELIPDISWVSCYSNNVYLKDLHIYLNRSKPCIDDMIEEEDILLFKADKWNINNNICIPYYDNDTSYYTFNFFAGQKYKKSFFIDYNLTKSYNHIHNIYEKHDLYLLQTLTIVNFGDIYNIHNVLQKNDFKSELILKVWHETFSLSDIMKNNYIIKLTYNALYFLETSIENMGQIYRYRCLVDQIQN